MGNILKPVTALAVLRLAQEGKSDLDRNVALYLKDWKLPENELVSGYEGVMVLASETHHRLRLASQPHEAVMNSPTLVIDRSDQHDPFRAVAAQAS